MFKPELQQRFDFKDFTDIELLQKFDATIQAANAVVAENWKKARVKNGLDLRDKVAGGQSEMTEMLDRLGASAGVDVV